MGWKLHENERNWVEREGASLAPPWIYQCRAHTCGENTREDPALAVINWTFGPKVLFQDGDTSVPGCWGLSSGIISTPVTHQYSSSWIIAVHLEIFNFGNFSPKPRTCFLGGLWLKSEFFSFRIWNIRSDRFESKTRYAFHLFYAQNIPWH